MPLALSGPGAARTPPLSPRTLTELRQAPLHRPWRRYLAAMTGAGAVLGLSWVGLERAAERLPEWERSVFTSLNELPDALRHPVWPVMQAGNFWATAAASAASYAVWRRPAPAVAVGVGGLSAWALAKVVKDIVVRGRPSDFLESVRIRQPGLNGFGFVSGHAAVACAIGAGLVPWLPRRQRAAVVGIAGAVGLSRVYVGAHLPLDTIGGGAIGVLCGLAAGLAAGVPDRQRTGSSTR